MKSIKFVYTGAVQNFAVPANVNQITLEIHGAEGGRGLIGYGGKGAFVMVKYAVTSNQVVYVYVGGAGTGATTTTAGTAGFNGGASGLYSSTYAHAGGGGGEI